MQKFTIHEELLQKLSEKSATCHQTVYTCQLLFDTLVAEKFKRWESMRIFNQTKQNIFLFNFARGIVELV